MQFNFQRGFSSAACLLRQWRLVESRRVAKQPEYKVGDVKPLYIPKQAKKFPDYPYGESHIFKQSNKGLYGASFIQFGNNVSESNNRTRRTWLPNVLRKSLWSEALKRPIKIKLTAKVLRTISKEGGIDNYLTKEKSARIKELGPTGWKLRYLVLKAQKLQENPPHKDAKIVKDSEGNDVTVYYEIPHNDTVLRITCGKRKLLYNLYPLELREYLADGKSLTYRDFLDNHQNLPIDGIVSKLHQYGFDFKQITI
ncbi:HER150Wp [Eremothecium sinecaudum]|uniref:Large ribosomal subunit protein bL28m n=1 Tax=Eremothecium sinecaudum TaxID=45286 RepID=A0A0X8HU09_9SACH|nr:HER150Wp [Eremothecium sinecaudum]AMD21429.1 HER150Wp [Eremothecium sinecaudum]